MNTKLQLGLCVVLLCILLSGVYAQQQTYDQFAQMNPDEKITYLNSNPENYEQIVKQYINDPTTDYTDIRVKSFANQYFSESNNHINQNKEAFTRYLKSENVDLRYFNSDIVSFNENGVLTGSQNSVDIHDFGQGVAFNQPFTIGVNENGKIVLIDLDNDKEIEFTGDLRRDTTNNIRIRGQGSINGHTFANGQNIVIDSESGNIDGNFHEIDGVVFSEVTSVSVNHEQNKLYLVNADIISVGETSTIQLAGKNINLPYELGDIPFIMKSGTLGFENGQAYVPKGEHLTLGHHPETDSMTIRSSTQDVYVNINQLVTQENAVGFNALFEAQGEGYSIDIHPYNPYLHDDIIMGSNHKVTVDMGGGGIVINHETQRMTVTEVEEDGFVDIINKRALAHFTKEQGEVTFDTQLLDPNTCPEPCVGTRAIIDGGSHIEFDKDFEPYPFRDSTGDPRPVDLFVNDGPRTFLLDQDHVYVAGNTNAIPSRLLTLYGATGDPTKEYGHVGFLYYDREAQQWRIFEAHRNSGPLDNPSVHDVPFRESSFGEFNPQRYLSHTRAGLDEIGIVSLGDTLSLERFQQYREQQIGAPYALYGPFQPLANSIGVKKGGIYCSKLVVDGVKYSTSEDVNLDYSWGVPAQPGSPYLVRVAHQLADRAHLLLPAEVMRNPYVTKIEEVVADSSP